MEYLQKNFSPCAWCESYGDGRRMVWNGKGEAWIDDEILFVQLNSIPISHTICPECKVKATDEINAVDFDNGGE